MFFFFSIVQNFICNIRQEDTESVPQGLWPAQNLDRKSLGCGVSVSWKYLMT